MARGNRETPLMVRRPDAPGAQQQQRQAQLIEMVPVGDLRPNPRNPNKHSEDQINRLMASLRRDGQTRPVLARKANRMLIGGHGVHTSVRRLQWPEIAVLFLDVDQQTADRIMLADDRLAALSELDDRRVADLMKEIGEGDWLATGYSVEEANKLLSSSEIADIEVYEIETSTVTDDFWVAVRGPLAMQAEVLEKMKLLLGEFPSVKIEIGTVEDT
jgi:ParB-like nuclease domain